MQTKLLKDKTLFRVSENCTGFLEWHPFRIYLIESKLVAVDVRFPADLHMRTRTGPISYSTCRKLLPLWYTHNTGEHKMLKQNKSIKII